MSKTRIFNFFKMIKVEIKVSWKSLVISSLGISLLALIPLMIASDINPNKGNQLVETITMVSSTLSQIYIYTVILRLRNVISDKSTLDKNRVAFLTHSKTTVVFSKVFIDTMAFIIPMTLTMGIGMPIILAKNGAISLEYVQKMIVLLFGISFVYVCTSLGMRFIDTLFLTKLKKGLLMGAWILLTLGITIIGAIVVGILGHVHKDGLTNQAAISEWLKTNGLGDIPVLSIKEIQIPNDVMHSHNIVSYGVQTVFDHDKNVYMYHLSNIIIKDQEIFTDSSLSIQNFFIDNQILVSILPIMNFITPFLPFYKLMDAWTVVPLMAEIVIFVIVIWRPLVKRLKTHLTT